MPAYLVVTLSVIAESTVAILDFIRGLGLA